jgi:hypothetical protein
MRSVPELRNREMSLGRAAILLERENATLPAKRHEIAHELERRSR